MSMIMNHDMTAIMGQRIMQRNSLAMRRSLEKLSTGMRTKIPDLDNTAELAIGETMKSRIYGMEKALNNSQDGISLIQTASGALESTQSLLMRMRELSVQAANDVLTQQDRSYIQVEINEIRDEITRIGDTTQFNRKNILSGDSAVLWSTTGKNVKAIIHGGLRSIDNYGQKSNVDGNFKISVRTTAGKAQVQKSDIFRIKHDDVLTDKNVNSDVGVKDVEISGEIPSGKYNLTLSQGSGQEAKVTGSFGIGGQDEDGNVYKFDDAFTLETSNGLADNASILFEVQNVNSNNGTVTLKATANILTSEGISKRKTLDNILLTEGSDSVNLDGLFGSDSLGIKLENSDYVNEGAKFSVSVSANSQIENSIGIDITGTNSEIFKDETLHYVLDGNQTGNKEIKFSNFFVNENSQQVTEGTITLTTDNSFRSADVGGRLNPDENTSLSSFEANYVGKIAGGDTKLSDVDKFWTVDGVFVLDEPRELTLTQGDGKQARIMLYADDTLNDVAKKLNNAVSIGLGQAQYVDEGAKFVTFVEGSTKGLESVEGTFVIRSVVAGEQGEIVLSGNEDVLKAFSLNTIQESKENQYDITVSDAHTNNLIAESVKITGNRLVGVIHQNVDVEFDSNFGLNIGWNDSTKNFEFTDTTNGQGSEFILHLADNTTVLQTGTGEGEDVMLNIGDMRAHALGLDSVNVMSQKSAAKALTIIDSAIDRVSMQQAKLGAAQNRLEHHIGNLTDEMQALIEANSTIMDTDYAKELMEFTRIRILMESNSAMLAQSNALHQQSILSIMRS
ncbi:MAG: flagellin [Synergistaceae bacterium]|nr:flagellin [Synergistaceae bacterium]